MPDPIQSELRFSEIPWTIKPLIPHSDVAPAARPPSDNGMAGTIDLIIRRWPNDYSPAVSSEVTRVFPRRSLSERIR